MFSRLNLILMIISMRPTHRCRSEIHTGIVIFNFNDKDNLQVQFGIDVGMATFYVHTQDNILQLEFVYTPPTNG